MGEDKTGFFLRHRVVDEEEDKKRCSTQHQHQTAEEIASIHSAIVAQVPRRTHVVCRSVIH